MGSLDISPETDLNLVETLKIYDIEREKRVRPEGLAQYEDIATSENLRHLAEDPWVDDSNLKDTLEVEDDYRCKAVVIGSGYGALLFAVRLILIAKFRPEDIVFVDNAGGFGGTWYWNRYPGLMCDVESASYMPLLEETGYVPKNRYSYGTELREYAELVASKWQLKDRAIFASRVTEAAWDDSTHQWTSTVTQRAINGKPARTFKIHSDFFLLTAGLLTRPKLPRLPGLGLFHGHAFHTSRWDYQYTGGSQEDARLEGLKGKRVAILGTGATAIQVVPQLAKWVKELWVIQRTPAAVDIRGQGPVDPVDFRDNIAVGPGWQTARRESMAALVSNSPAPNLVRDGWTTFPSFSGLVGGPNAGKVTPATVDEYLMSLHILDLPRQQRVRDRVEKVVKDKATAAALKPWYPGWCKRPCFHDDYLASFNEPNVHLVDTLGAGVERVTENGIVANGKSIPLDVLVYSTGFETFRGGDPSSRARMTVKGRGGLTMSQKWADGVGTLHGIFSHDFPNLILPGGSQAAGTVNVVHTYDVMATHAATVIARVSKNAAAHQKILIEPSAKGEAEWVDRIVGASLSPSPMAKCTPSYSNGEGAAGRINSPEEKLKAAKAGAWPSGLLNFATILADWRANEKLEGLDIQII